jgi:ElaB/YqjD/DUF883 family membrane-anchored ribosome-binding protein
MTTRADTAGKIQNGADTVVSLDKVTDAIESGADAARETARAAVEKGREVLSQGRDVATKLGDATQEYTSRNAEAAYRGARDAAERASKGTSEFVRERPLTSLAIAAGIGVISALLLGRRRR